MPEIIVFDDGKIHDSVEVAGEFSDWTRIPLNNYGTRYSIAFDHLRPGDYMYKFVVDQRWALAGDDRPSSITDGCLNQVLLLTLNRNG